MSAVHICVLALIESKQFSHLKGLQPILKKLSYSRLQLRFNYGGKRHYLSTGLADTVANRKLAELRAAEIEKDILFERFDPTLEKYNPRSVLSTVTPITPSQKLQPKLDELWDKYSEFKKPQVSPSTYAKDFIKHRNYIAKLPT